jgi:hypothetical protein
LSVLETPEVDRTGLGTTRHGLAEMMIQGRPDRGRIVFAPNLDVKVWLESSRQ